MPYARESLSRNADTRSLHLDRVVQQFRNTPLIVVTDYDGTLVPIADTPDLALPDADLMALLKAVAARPQTDLHIVSGRPRKSLDDLFGHLPISLWAEHGFWHRPAPDRPWEAAASALPEWLTKIRPIIEHFTATTPGSAIEEKTAGYAWHYRHGRRPVRRAAGRRLADAAHRRAPEQAARSAGR